MLPIKLFSFLLGLLFALVPTFLLASTPDQAFIYGTVTTIDDVTYTGQIRWGKEEAFWTDHFNVSKTKNENLVLLDKETRDDLQGNNSQINRTSILGITLWKNEWNYSRSLVHQFVCPFGTIANIKVTGSDKALVTLRNGQTIAANGSGYNDVGTTVQVYDNELGHVKLDWDRIQTVDFAAPPKNFNSAMGAPLMGKVELASGETFEGRVTWDNDERMTDDKLDGHTDDGKLSIPLGNIASIQNKGNASLVTLKSGREMKMHGTNDCNSRNRGIIVTTDNGMQVEVSWDEFDQLTLADGSAYKGMTYDDYASPRELRGKLTTVEGQEMTGEILYDLDEQYDFEILQGMKDEVEYLIPIGLVKEITPKNHAYTKVTMRDGSTLLLGTQQDVCEKNHGILVLNQPNDPQYVAWDQLESLTFD